MKKNALLLGCLLLLIQVSFAQNMPDPVAETDYFKFGQWTAEDKSAIVFADVCNVRSAPDTKSEVVGKLTIGTTVQLLELSSAFTQSGIASQWIKIKTASVMGYVWGGLLTNATVKLPDGRLALWGLTEIKPAANGQSKVYASIRVADKGTVAAKHDFEVKYGSNPDEGSLSLSPPPALSGVKGILTFNTLSEACGVYASEHYLLYTAEGRLFFIGSGFGMGDGGQLHTSKAYVFPYIGGDTRNFHYSPSKDHIFLIEDDGSYNDDCIWIETYRVKDFSWSIGLGLTPNCEY